MSKHPITPPIALIAQWIADIDAQTADPTPRDLSLALEAAQWGADQELEACREWLRIGNDDGLLADMLYEARRPKPPSLKQKAIQSLGELPAHVGHPSQITTWVCAHDHALILRALEALPDD